MKLTDVRPELARELGHVRSTPEAAGRHNYVVAGNHILTDHGAIPATRLRLQPFDSGARTHRQVKVECVMLQIVADLVLSREVPALRRERQAWQSVVLG